MGSGGGGGVMIQGSVEDSWLLTNDLDEGTKCIISMFHVIDTGYQCRFMTQTQRIQGIEASE